jgi:hypothetical protein
LTARLTCAALPREMKDYKEITTQTDMEALLSMVVGFHDSMAKEIRVINHGFVLPDHSMDMGHRFDCQILIQSQWEPFALELLACKMLNLDISDAGDYGGAEGKVISIESPAQRREIQLRFDASLSILSERLFYAVRPDWLGPKSRFRGDMPGPDAIDADALDGRWRQCSGCCDAWDEDTDLVFSICPTCRCLTELKQRQNQAPEDTPLRADPQH